MEIERKWIIDFDDIPYNLSNYNQLDIEQAYIMSKPTIRIRKISNLNKYILTVKSSSKDKISRQEYEIEINKELYDELLTKKKGLTISKTRYCIPVDKYIYEIDLFHNEYEGLAYLEIEFSTIEEAKEYIEPSWIKKEVTFLKGYSNSSLAKGNKKLFKK
ncbi:MAG: hypothetical protein Q4E33_02005 [Erysipelotrichaceae bacterium]|nr:hypothetical protein [Erysipelotrichaceae bacterium]